MDITKNIKVAKHRAVRLVAEQLDAPAPRGAHSAHRPEVAPMTFSNAWPNDLKVSLAEDRYLAQQR